MARLRMRLAGSLAVFALAAATLVTAAPAAAAPLSDPSVTTSLYFPWIPNNETLAGAGPWIGAVTLQNLEDVSVQVGFSTTDTTRIIEAHSSIRLSTGQLGIGAPGSQLVVTANWNGSDLPDLVCTPLDTSSFTQTVQHNTVNGADVVTLTSGKTFVDVTSVKYGSTTFVQGTDYKIVKVDDQTFNVDWSLSGAEPPTGAAYAVTYEYTTNGKTEPDCSRAPHIAGAEKQAMPNGPTTFQTDGSLNAVDGYTALTDDGLDDVIYLPIVQLNNSWQSIIHVSNPTDTDTTVTLDLTVAANLSSGGNVSQSFSLGAGKSTVINLVTLVPTGWIGSARLSSSSTGITALVDRVKPSTQMALINVAQPEGSATVDAALIFRDYFDWKTGINLANVGDADNTVSITYYNPNGTVLTTDTVTIPANGMKFVYLPDQAATGAFAGMAELSGQAPFLVALDEVKYTTTEAMSYLVTDQDQLATAGDMLALPVVQKGDPDSGLGDTSGLNLFNPSNSTVNFSVTYYDLAGNQKDFQALTLNAHQGRTVYTLDQDNLPIGFQGSAVVRVTSGGGSLAAISNNVNYAVGGDGSSVYSLERISAPPS